MKTMENPQTLNQDQDQIEEKEDIDPKEYYWDRPIFITGVPRSGTSMLSGLFHISGVWKGKTIGPSKENPKGFFENASLRESVLKPYLRSIGADALGQKPLPRIEDCTIDQNIKNRIKRILLDESYHRGPWLWKDAKLLLTFPLWVELYPEALWLIVKRNPASVARSCLRTGFMRAEQTLEGWEKWVKDYESRVEHLQAKAKHSAVVNTDILIEQGAEYLLSSGLVSFFGLPNFDKERANNFISKQFWHY